MMGWLLTWRLVDLAAWRRLSPQERAIARIFCARPSRVAGKGLRLGREGSS